MEKATIIQLVIALTIGSGLGALLGYYGKCSTGTCPLTANPVRGSLYGMALGLMFFLAAGPSSWKQKPVLSDESSQALMHVTDVEAFEKAVLNAEHPVLVDFYSDFCGPCRMLGPTIVKLAQDYDGQALICKVDVNRLPALAKRYGIHGIPCVLFFQDGREIERIIGFHEENAYKEVLDRMNAS